MKTLRSANLGAVIASVVLLTGYAGAAEPEATNGENALNAEAPKLVDAAVANTSTPASQESKWSEYDLYHTIVKGENLSVLAKRLTGDASNWKAIAKANQLDDEGSVQPGQIIRIPAVLAKAAIETVPSPEWAKTQVAGESTPDTQDSAKTVTVPASFKGVPPKDLPEKSE